MLKSKSCFILCTLITALVYAVHILFQVAAQLPSRFTNVVYAGNTIYQAIANNVVNMTPSDYTVWFLDVLTFWQAMWILLLLCMSLCYLKKIQMTCWTPLLFTITSILHTVILVVFIRGYFSTNFVLSIVHLVGAVVTYISAVCSIEGKLAKKVPAWMLTALRIVLLNGIALYAAYSVSFFFYSFDLLIVSIGGNRFVSGIVISLLFALTTVVYFALDISIFEPGLRHIMAPYACWIWQFTGILDRFVAINGVAHPVAIIVIIATVALCFFVLGKSYITFMNVYIIADCTKGPTGDPVYCRSICVDKLTNLPSYPPSKPIGHGSAPCGKAFPKPPQRTPSSPPSRHSTC